MKISRVKGFSDILPGEIETWQFLEDKAREVFSHYNFSEIRIPILEKTELFSRSLGETTDIVEKEMYTFADQDAKGSLLTLRPEGTASVVRAYVEAGLYQVEPVRKLFYLGPMFRRERPQKGRLRQFYQIGAEVLGRGDPYVDAEILLLLSDFFVMVGLCDLTLELNSLGCVQCRPRYREHLLVFLRKRERELCENCRRRMERNPLRVLDCKVKSCFQVTSEAPSILDYLCEACRGHFGTVERLLTETKIKYGINPRMVRGLDYYCRTTFEWTSTQLGSQNTVAAGGRYDGLVEDLGGPPVPGVGFALGMERMVLLFSMKETKRQARLALYIAWIGSAARSWSFPVVHRLRRKGFRVEMEWEEKSLKSQMRRADKLGAQRVLIVGEEEFRKERGLLRDMDSKEQVEISLDEIESNLMKQLTSCEQEGRP
ncbi:MAG: histidine--tRNA ligase [Deltaproteobacteria bacterium]|nr:histidine--tRNA ligase [Deltaproteobacteria bacterium]MCZ6906726.1 histidine--tRNA ligase [Deltaproteobacteria bacterium]